MKLGNTSFVKNLGVVTCAAALLTSLTTAQAATATMIDNGSTAFVNLDSSAGMSSWTVTGLLAGQANQLNQQWFWYAIGNGSPQPINNLSAAAWSMPSANQLIATYASSQVSVTIGYTLTGGGIGQADIQEGITLQNQQPSNPIDFHFYQYSDFNLLNDPLNDTVTMVNNFVLQWKGDTQIAESIVAPDASHFEANYTGVAGNTLSKLNGVLPVTLNDHTDAGPGDVTWAFQWDFMNLGTQTIEKDKLLDVEIVPEPSTVALVSLGLAAFLLRRRAQA